MFCKPEDLIKTTLKFDFSEERCKKKKCQHKTFAQYCMVKNTLLKIDLNSEIDWKPNLKKTCFVLVLLNAANKKQSTAKLCPEQKFEQQKLNVLNLKHATAMAFATLQLI